MSFELRLVKKDGHAFYARLECMVITNKGNDSKQIRMAVNDITGLKEAEALRESEEKYRVLFEGNTHGILITDGVTGRFVDANLSICQMLGYSKTALLQLGIADIHPKDSLDLVISDIKFQERGGKPVGRAIPCLREDGTVFYADIVGAKTIVYGRRCNVGFFIDTTERKQAEEALRESEERYRALFERSLELVYLFDFEGNFIDANNVALELLGYTKDNIKSLNFGSLLTDDQLPLAVETTEEILKTGSQKEVAEYKLRRKNGEYVYVESMGAIIYRDGKPFAIQGIARDITERKQSEEQRLKLEVQLQQSQKMEAIGTLAGGVAHEFNNALSSITGHAGLLEMEYPEDEKIMDYAKAMMQSAHRMAHLTSQLLAYARGGKYNPATMSLSNFLEGTLPIIQHLLDPNIRVVTFP